MRHLIALEKGEDPATLTPPSPFHHDTGFVISTWMQHKIHHTYPRAGGYEDQDELLMEDWQTMNLYYMRAQAGIYTPVITPDMIGTLASMGGE